MFYECYETWNLDYMNLIKRVDTVVDLNTIKRSLIMEAPAEGNLKRKAHANTSTRCRSYHRESRFPHVSLLTRRQSPSTTKGTTAPACHWLDTTKSGIENVASNARLWCRMTN